MKKLIVTFSELGLKDLPLVGGKNASLGEMYNQLSDQGILIPNGFATTSSAFWQFLDENNIEEKLEALLKDLNRKTYANLHEIGEKARKYILDSKFSEAFSEEIFNAYQNLTNNKLSEVAVRSSATAEDLPQASFAGQHDTYLNIKGKDALLVAVKNCFASLYTDRAIKYREDNGFLHSDVALSVGVQKMVRSDKACSGVGFTLEPESGFQQIIHLSGVWGLGENIVQGTVNPDEFYVFKPTLELGKNAIVQKKLGDKSMTLIYAESNGHSSTVNIPTEIAKQQKFVLTDLEVLKLANWALAIEKHYNKAMDIEWAKDGITNELFITQARPETVHHSKAQTGYSIYNLIEKGEVLVTGNAIGTKISVGTARLLQSPKDSHKLKEGDIIVTNTTSPDWDPLLKKAGGIVTNTGGRTSHAAIVARELGVPAVVGSKNATESIKDGEIITVSCAEGKTGFIYKGKLDFEENFIDLKNIKLPETEANLFYLIQKRLFNFLYTLMLE